jgi:single-strand DNA-binding protein
MFARVIIMGRLTKKPELRPVTVKNEQRNVCSIGLAVTERKDRTSFFDVDFWGLDAERLAKFCDKGSMIVVHGRLEDHKYTNDKGVEVKTKRIVEDEWFFGEPKRSDEDAPAPTGDAPESWPTQE